MPDLRALEAALHTSTTNQGDGISAVIVAVEMIKAHCRKLKYTRSIVLVTNGTGSFDTSDAASIVDEMKTHGIDLTVLGVDFDDEEFGFKE